MAFVLCGECAERSPEGVQFCGRCGAFLDWEAQSPAVVQPAAPPGNGPAVEPSPVNPPPPTTPQPAPVVHRPDEVPQQRRRLVVPEEPEPLAPGERPCRACGTGNDPTRRFCRSCGASLARAPSAEPRPAWWRRLLARLTGRHVHRAGDRRRVAEPVRWWRPVLLMAVLLGLVTVCALPNRGFVDRMIDEVRDRTTKHVPVTPVAARASSAAPNTGAERVFDGASNRYWAPAGAAEGAWIEVDFERPVRLLDVIVTAGVSADRQQFLAQGRPHELEVTMTARTGDVTRTTLALRDMPGGQTFTVKASDVVRVRFAIASTYGTPNGRLCALAELEFGARG